MILNKSIKRYLNINLHHFQLEASKRDEDFRILWWYSNSHQVAGEILLAPNKLRTKPVKLIAKKGNLSLVYDDNDGDTSAL